MMPLRRPAIAFVGSNSASRVGSGVSVDQDEQVEGVDVRLG
jgi:hypothetical protein